MVRMSAKGTSDFQIGYDTGKNPSFAPGDTIVGFVWRKSPLVSPNATIKVTLAGRTKARIYFHKEPEYSSGNSHLVDEAALLQTILDGPIHIAAGDAAHEWRFAINIPTKVNDAWWLANSPTPNHIQPCGENDEEIDTLPLPASFDTNIPGGQTTVRDAYIEYYIWATIAYTQKSTRYTEEVILPVTIRNTHPGPPITDFDLARTTIRASVTSFKLLPQSKGAGFSFTQKRRQLFHSSKVPCLGGGIEVILPRTVQLDNPNPVPLKLRFVPEADRTSSDVLGTPVKVELVGVKMTIHSAVWVLVKVPEYLEDVIVPQDDDGLSVELWPPRGGVKDPIYIPCSEEKPALDVGERIGFRIGRFQRLSKVRRGVDMAPDFATFNIGHEHFLRLEIEVKIADEYIKKKLQGLLTILPWSDGLPTPSATAGPGSPAVAGSAALQEDAAPPPAFEHGSESWIQPPADIEAPPTFAEVQREDAIRRNRNRRVDGSAGPHRNLYMH